MIPTKEEVLKKCLGGVEGISDNGFKQEWGKELNAMDEYADIVSKERAIGFFKWNGQVILEYVKLLKENISKEKQKEIEEFELASVEKRFNQYLNTLP